ncbi:MAG: hypothetical protein JWM21_2907 [Acidobacteria bacterium]|nr:hypothetical protein [Acidobacteriota bacterium]
MTSPRRAFLAIILGSVIIASAIGAFRWARRRTITSQSKIVPASTNTADFLSVPPFSTKEPDRYQCKRIITSVEYQDAQPTTTTNTTLIARDGDKRREDYQSASGDALVYLETPAGHFILSPGRKLYADLNAAEAESGIDGAGDGPTGVPDYSPERLLNETPTLARYENLGGERINERNTTKYRVTARETNNGAGTATVSLIWIDDALGMPVRSETSSTAGEHPATLTMELRDLKETVDSGIFELPKDYRKVDQRRFFVESGITLGLAGNEGTASLKL